MRLTLFNNFARRTLGIAMSGRGLILACTFGVIAGCGWSTNPSDSNAPRPRVGDPAPNFELADLQGKRLSLTALRQAGPVVLVVLRGFPGYHCPVCQRQAARFIAAAESLREHVGSVVLVYPGAAADLEPHARKFLAESELPEGFHFALDRDYELVCSYGLRRSDPGETAHPATFLISSSSQILFAKAADVDGGRASPDEVLRVLTGE